MILNFLNGGRCLERFSDKNVLKEELLIGVGGVNVDLSCFWVLGWWGYFLFNWKVLFIMRFNCVWIDFLGF